MKTTLLKLSSCLMFIGMAHLSIAGGTTTSQSRNVEPFTGITLKNSANVYVTQGATQSIRIEAEQSAIAKITTTVENGKLVISNDGALNTNKEIKIIIMVKELNSVSIEGSGNIESKTPFTCKEFVAKISGSGNISMNISTERLDANIKGSGNLTLKGKATKSRVGVAGSGTADLAGLPTVEAGISITGSGDCKVNATDNLVSNIIGSGNVLYVTLPPHHTDKLIGSGKVKQM